MVLFSPHSRISQVPLHKVLDAVHYLLFRWGFIPVFRVDNGSPFGDPARQALSVLNMHLLALGIQVKLNPPRSPVKNAKVERSQGTTCRWAEPNHCSDFMALQHRLNQAIEDQREHYPSRTCKGETRAQTYPALFTNPKRFHPDCFDVQRVYKHLSNGNWERKVSAQGVISLFTAEYQIGYKSRNTSVSITFDALLNEWIVRNRKGDLIKNLTPKNLSHEMIFSLSTRQ
jgi:hypothetical protein